MAYVYQEFPKWKYHPEQGRKVVKNADEEKSLGKGWYDNPGQFPKPSRLATTLDERVKPWWTKWQWLVAAVGLVVGILVGITELVRALHSSSR